MTEKKRKKKRPGAHRSRDADYAPAQDSRRAEQRKKDTQDIREPEQKDSGAGEERHPKAKAKNSRHGYRNRNRTDSVDAGRSFQTKDETFSESGTFGEEKRAETPDRKKSGRLQKKAEKAGKKAAAARNRLPKRTVFSVERVFDEKGGRAKYVLTTAKTPKPGGRDSAVKKAARRLNAGYAAYVHGKLAEAEQENAAVEGAHKTEQRAEEVYRFAKSHRRGKVQKRQERAEKLERRHFRKEVNFAYQKFLEENPQMQKKALQKRLQKERIKREYRKAKQRAEAGRTAGQAAWQSKNMTVSAARKVQEIAAKNAGIFATAGVVGLLLLIVMMAVSSCGAMFADVQSTVLAASYLSKPQEIDAADLKMTQLELALQEEIDRIETDYPDYDEYAYNLGEIGHDPFALIGYLSAVHTEFTASEVEGEIQSLFDEMYTLTLTPDTEVRTRTVTKTGTRTVTDPVTGAETEEEYEYEEEEEYEVSILRVTLTAIPLAGIVSGKMDAEQAEIYGMYGETKGLLQVFDSPLHLYWYSYVSGYYGWRKDIATGNGELHRGVDIAVPVGTAVYAAHDGTVTAAAYDSHYGKYVVIEKDGYTTKYAHMDSLNVVAGEEVERGSPIGTTGNTGSSMGSHLHIECLYGGEYYNPLFYFEAGEGTVYGEPPGGAPGDVLPPEGYDDAAVQALMEEAARYIGYPYMWGGYSPATGFDCSGFVCFVFTNSGVRDLPRTTAQGIYSQCTPVSASAAKPGDIIFFTGTYHSGTPVTHVGIYCGNGVMAHAGDPVKYSSVNSPYWQRHFYGFGRLR